MAYTTRLRYWQRSANRGARALTGRSLMPTSRKRKTKSGKPVRFQPRQKPQEPSHLTGSVVTNPMTVPSVTPIREDPPDAEGWTPATSITREDEYRDTRVGVLTPTHDRPDMVRMLAMQMALQERPPDVLCIHQNGLPDSYAWAIADLPLPFEVIWIHTPAPLPQVEWYRRPLGELLNKGCTHFFWCDDDDLYRSNHLSRGLRLLTDRADPCDFVINGYCGLLFRKKAGFAYKPSVRWEVHDPGGMSSSMAFNRAFATELFQDLLRTQGQYYWADNIVKRETMPKFRCRLELREEPSTIYVCHPGTQSSSHWLADID